MARAEGLDLSRMAPGDAIAALRSYPRRFRALLTTFDDDDRARADDLVHRAGPDGRSAVDHADHVARSVAVLAQALRQVLVEDDPVLVPAVADDDSREWAVPAPPASVDAVLDFLTVECEALADEIASVPSGAWDRKATVAGRDLTVTALDVVREVVRTGSEHLRAAERAIEAAKRG